MLALERGGWRDTPTDFAPTFAQDELRYYWRHELFQEPAHETLTSATTPSETALPMRQLGSFLPGTGVGGAGIHWNGQTWRFLPIGLRGAQPQPASATAPTLMPDDMTIQDWGVTYDELEPHYDKFEYLCGISRQGRQPQGRRSRTAAIRSRAPRAREYPNPPLDMTYAPTLFAEAARELGHQPVPAARRPTCRAPTPIRSACSSGPCTYCGFCEKFGCGNYSKASAADDDPAGADAQARTSRCAPNAR